MRIGAGSPCVALKRHLSLILAVIPSATSLVSMSGHRCSSAASVISRIAIGSFCEPRRWDGDPFRSLSWNIQNKTQIRRGSRHTATIAPVVEEVEEDFSRLPSWDKIRISKSLDRLEQELTRHPFTDETWQLCAGSLKGITVSLANNLEPFKDNPYLPVVHAATLVMLLRLVERSRSASSGNTASRGNERRHGRKGVNRGAPENMYSSLKYCLKKSGLGREAAYVRDGVCPKYESSQARITAACAVERCLTEVCLIWPTARLLEAHAPAETKRDFVFHLRSLLEHAPSRDRQDVLVTLCRGFFTPGHNNRASRNHDNVHGAALRPEFGGYSLAETFAEIQEGASKFPGALRAARQAYPFLEILARWAWRCQTVEPNESSSTTTQKMPGDGQNDNMLDGKEGVVHDSAVVNGVAVMPRRSRRNTGVASLLVALAKADPSGDTIQSMQRWACEALLPEKAIRDEWRPYIIEKNEVATRVAYSNHVSVEGKKHMRFAWMRTCRELGDILRLLVGALDEEHTGRQSIKYVVNHALFITTFMRSMDQGALGRRGYERLVATGRVPGDTKVSVGAIRGARTCVKSWREATQVLEMGMADVLDVSLDAVKSTHFQDALSKVLTTWRSPHALADYFVMQQEERKVMPQYRSFLRALLGLSNETVRDLRVHHPANRFHMSHFPPLVQELWEAEPSALPGTSDPELIFRMGEDTRTCMGIRRSCQQQNRALIGYLLQSNMRLLVVQSPEGRVEARSVLRLLLRRDNMEPVIFMDKIYYASEYDASLEEEARSASKALNIPLYLAGDKTSRPVDTDVGVVLPCAEEARIAWGALGDNLDSANGTSRCELVEVDGISSWVYAGDTVGTNRFPTLVYRGGLNRSIVLAELEYAEQFHV